MPLAIAATRVTALKPKAKANSPFRLPSNLKPEHDLLGTCSFSEVRPPCLPQRNTSRRKERKVSSQEKTRSEKKREEKKKREEERRREK